MEGNRVMKQYISEEYRQLNAELHKTNKVFGNGRNKWMPCIKQIAREVSIKTVLDYGCGKGNLVEALRKVGFVVEGYDPAVAKYEAIPESGSDLVVCCDVLEHVEEEFVEDVLDRLKELSSTAFFAVIAMRPSNKILSDGRNTHITLFPSEKWMELLQSRFPEGSRISYRNKNKLIFKWMK